MSPACLLPDIRLVTISTVAGTSYETGADLAPNGTIWGDGIDDIAAFTIRGFFDAAKTRQAGPRLT